MQCRPSPRLNGIDSAQESLQRRMWPAVKYVHSLPDNVYSATWEGKFGNFGLEPVRVYVMPCYSPWMSVDGATGAAYVALLAADNEDDFWQAATSLQITRDDRDYPQQRRLSLSSLRHLVQDLALVLTMRRQWKHFRFVCTCVLAYNSCLHLSGPIVLPFYTETSHRVLQAFP